jgi:hypothetical protein
MKLTLLRKEIEIIKRKGSPATTSSGGLYSSACRSRNPTHWQCFDKDCLCSCHTDSDSYLKMHGFID